MLIKEIIAISAVLLASIFVIHPAHFRETVQNVKIQILREVGRTNNWGNPSIFLHRQVKR